MNTMTNSQKIQAINNFLKSAPGFCLSNYSDRAGYQADWRTADAQRKEAKKLWNNANPEKLIAIIDAGDARRGSGLYWDTDGGIGYRVYGYGPLEKFKRMSEALRECQN